jgi:hypothetical protein
LISFVTSKNALDTLNTAIQKAGFILETDLKDEFYLTALAVYKKGDSRIDVFLKKVGQMLQLTHTMIKRAKHFKDYGKLSVHLVSVEDIFLFKAMTPRPGDVTDCDVLMKGDLDYDVIYDEIVEQSTAKHKWCFWVYEKLAAIENYNGITTSLKPKVYNLVKEHWDERPNDFMKDILYIEKHIPDARLRKELAKKGQKLGQKKGLE